MSKSLTKSLIKSAYARGVFWVLLASLFSSGNDLLMQFVGEQISPMQVTFIRAFISFVILLPIMISKGIDSFKTARPAMHILRALIGFAAISFWCYGTASGTHLSLVSTISLTVPILTLPLAYIFLREKITKKQLIVVIFGFIGILIALSQDNIKFFEDSSLDLRDFGLKGSISLIIGAIFFALSDIVNKSMVKNESQLAMLFYFALGVAIVGFYPAYKNWATPDFSQWTALILLGAGSNLVLYCLLRGFKETSVSSLAPYRYSELMFAAFFDLVFFAKSPQLYTMVAATIIIPTTFIIAMHEAHKQNK